MTQPWPGFFLLLVGFAAFAAQAQSGKEAPRIPGNVYCCLDAAGKRTCSETVPAQCSGRTYFIYGKSGILLRKVDPPISAAERERLAAEKIQQQQQQQVLREKRRRRDAILATYSSLDELNRLQAQAENPLKQDIAEAQAKIDETRKRLKASEETASRYEKAQVPTELASNITSYNMEIKFQNELIKMKQQELDTIQKKFEKDRKFYQEIMK
ncbi:MAG: hypothetical protein LBO00_10165 [Zoogloeaceae bacterium]|jgi:hypothetical protein|nr:hypothetical protein [Zoogloeaceae bacterium]